MIYQKIDGTLLMDADHRRYQCDQMSWFFSAIYDNENKKTLQEKLKNFAKP